MRADPESRWFQDTIGHQLHPLRLYLPGAEKRMLTFYRNCANPEKHISFESSLLMTKKTTTRRDRRFEKLR